MKGELKMSLDVINRKCRNLIFTQNIKTLLFLLLLDCGIITFTLVIILFLFNITVSKALMCGFQPYLQMYINQTPHF